jgi:hypothetical protein
MADYMTVAGLIQFDPTQRTAAGKEVKDIVIRAVGNNKQISITVWPEQQHIPLNKGDFIVADGSYSSKPGQNKHGEQVTYHNLSATTLHNLTNQGGATPAPTTATATPASSADDDDDFPF